MKKKTSRKRVVNKNFFILTFLSCLCIIFGFIFFLTHTSFQHAASNPIQAENALPGTANWPLTNPSRYANHDIEGYANATSVAPGQTITFYVRTQEPGFTADIYRLGWYQGIGARYVGYTLHSNNTNASAPIPTPQTGYGYLVEANWNPSFSVTIPPNWVTGVYIVKLRADNSAYQSYIRFIVKSTTHISPFIFVYEDNSDEAYNYYGNASLYKDPSGNFPSYRPMRASFNRPYRENEGFGRSLVWNYPLIRWIEQNGYDISYVSDIDVNANNTILQGHNAIIVGGHSEYWTKNMRDGLDAALAQGVNLAVFGANSLYWNVGYDTVHRFLGTYKDPTNGVYYDPNYPANKQLVTAQWRDGQSLNRPEQSILGAMYSSYFNEQRTPYPWIVNNPNSWIFAGTGAKQGTTVNGLVGYEYDKSFPGYKTPGNLTTVSYSPVVNIYNQNDVQETTLSQQPSGAWVFDAATIFWSWGLDNWSASYTEIPASRSTANLIIQRITANIFNFFLPMATATPASPTNTPTPTPTTDPNITPTLTPSLTPTPIFTPPANSCLDAGGYRLYNTECSSKYLCGGSACTAGCGHNPTACAGTCTSSGQCSNNPGQPYPMGPTPTIPPSSCLDAGGYRGYMEECNNLYLCGGSACTAGCGHNPSACLGGAANCVSGQCRYQPNGPHPL